MRKKYNLRLGLTREGVKIFWLISLAFPAKFGRLYVKHTPGEILNLHMARFTNPVTAETINKIAIWSFGHTNRQKTDPFCCIRPIFCLYPEKIGRIKIGKFLYVRPIFSVLEKKLDRRKKSDGRKKRICFLPVRVNEA
jgi:hypothetical protein